MKIRNPNTAPTISRLANADASNGRGRRTRAPTDAEDLDRRLLEARDGVVRRVVEDRDAEHAQRQRPDLLLAHRLAEVEAELQLAVRTAVGDDRRVELAIGDLGDRGLLAGRAAMRSNGRCPTS